MLIVAIGTVFEAVGIAFYGWSKISFEMFLPLYVGVLGVSRLLVLLRTTGQLQAFRTMLPDSEQLPVPPPIDDAAAEKFYVQSQESERSGGPLIFSLACGVPLAAMAYGAGFDTLALCLLLGIPTVFTFVSSQLKPGGCPPDEEALAKARGKLIAMRTRGALGGYTSLGFFVANQRYWQSWAMRTLFASILTVCLSLAALAVDSSLSAGYPLIAAAVTAVLFFNGRYLAHAVAALMQSGVGRLIKAVVVAWVLAYSVAKGVPSGVLMGLFLVPRPHQFPLTELGRERLLQDQKLPAEVVIPTAFGAFDLAAWRLRKLRATSTDDAWTTVSDLRDSLAAIQCTL